ncbi:MAG: hypothetical protein ACOX1S_12395 [Anaerostipes sp.]|jgi:hypothetical protein
MGIGDLFRTGEMKETICQLQEAQELKQYVGQLNAQHQQLQQAINTTNYS